MLLHEPIEDTTQNALSYFAHDYNRTSSGQKPALKMAFSPGRGHEGME